MNEHVEANSSIAGQPAAEHLAAEQAATEQIAGVLPITGQPCDPTAYGSDVLAVVGDGVFGLLVREYLVAGSRAPAARQHSRAVEMVRCEAQAAYYRIIEPYLTEEEQGVFRRGRNHHAPHTPRRNVADYRTATGLEALFGYLYLCGRRERLRTLFLRCVGEIPAEEQEE